MDLAEEVPIKKNRIYTEEEKRGYCEAYVQSGMTQVAFCKEQGISKSALLQWRHDYAVEEGFGFVRTSIKTKGQIAHGEKIEIRLRLSNSMELLMAVNETRLLTLIQELSHATAVIR